MVIGVGGLGCPASKVLAEAGVRLRFVDDDRVDPTNLHRQTLFDESHIGELKARVAADILGGECIIERFRPATAPALLDGINVIVEGSDNLATKFFACDIAGAFGVPIVQAGAVAWNGWALATRPNPAEHTTCLRCIFEEIPPEGAPSCAEVGVVGPVVGVVGALQAALALRLMHGPDPCGAITTFDGRSGRLRTRVVAPTESCVGSAPTVDDCFRSRYTSTCDLTGPHPRAEKETET